MAEPDGDIPPTWERIIEEAKKSLDGNAASLENDPADIVRQLNKLAEIQVSKPLLQKTKIGLVVAKLRTHKDENVRDQATKLVTQWKEKVSSSKSSSSVPVDKGSTTDNTGTHPNDSSARKRPRPVETTTSDASPTQSSVSASAKYSGPLTHIDKRDKCREFLFRAFLEGVTDDQRNMLDVQNVSDLTAEIEQALWEHHVDKCNKPADYNTQIRSIKANLGDKRNPEFNARIYLGAVTVTGLITMQSSEMASDAKKRERQKAKKDALEACQSDWDLRNVKRAKGQFPCGKCRSDNTTYFQMQTRSSDEPMTTYVNCLNCGKRWKF